MRISTLTLPLLQLLSLAKSAAAAAPQGFWDEFKYAPATRTVRPVAIHSFSGPVSSADALLAENNGTASIGGNESWVAVDFGQEVCPPVPLSLFLDLPLL